METMKSQKSSQALPSAKGTKPLTTLPKGVKSLATPDGGAVVSILENAGKLYLVVVNRSPNDELTLNIELALSSLEAGEHYLLALVQMMEQYISAS